jgi:hypothetical protein
MLLPFFEREWEGSADIATIRALSGASVEPPSGAPLQRWRHYATSQGWVAGYLQLAPALDFGVPLQPHDELLSVNTVFLLDLRGRNVLGSASRLLRRKVRTAEKLGVELVTDRLSLLDALLALYPSTMKRVGARSIYAVAPATLERWVDDPTSLVLGARLRGSVQAVYLLSTAGSHAESHIMVSTLEGRALTGWLMWSALERLRLDGIELANLGGGVRPGDGVYEFKARFNGQPKPLLAVRQIYDAARYQELCRRAGVPPTCEWFPAYRRAEAGRR